MSIIYLVRLPDEDTDPDSLLFPLLPSDRLDKMKRYRRACDRLLCYTAGLVAVRAAVQLTGGNIFDTVLVSDNLKPPFAQSCGELVRLGISHSGHYAAVIADRFPCGIDVEELTRSSGVMEAAEAFLHPHEREELASEADLSERLMSFYKLWTVKESYLKYLGTGLSRPLDSFCVSCENGSYIIRGDNTVKVLCRTLTDACFSAVYCGKEPDIYEYTYSGLLNELREMINNEKPVSVSGQRDTSEKDADHSQRSCSYDSKETHRA